jgi:hypothetical protein
MEVHNKFKSVEDLTLSRKSAHRGRLNCQPHVPAALYPEKGLPVFISVKGRINPKAKLWGQDWINWKHPIVAQRLNHLRCRVPLRSVDWSRTCCLQNFYKKIEIREFGLQGRYNGCHNDIEYAYLNLTHWTAHAKLKSLVKHFKTRRKILRSAWIFSVRGRNFNCNTKEQHSNS